MVRAEAECLTDEPTHPIWLILYPNVVWIARNRDVLRDSAVGLELNLSAPVVSDAARVHEIAALSIGEPARRGVAAGQRRRPTADARRNPIRQVVPPLLHVSAPLHEPARKV